MKGDRLNSNLPALRSEQRSLKGRIGRRYDAIQRLRQEVADLSRKLRETEAAIREQGGRIREHRHAR